MQKTRLYGLIVVSNWYFEVSYAEQLVCYSRAAESVTKAGEHSV